MTTQYILKEHIEGTILAGEDVKLFPGKWAPYDEVKAMFSFGTYMAVPNSLYLMPYIKTDNVSIKIYSKSYDKMIGYVTNINDDLNRLNQHDNAAFFTACDVEGIRLMEVASRVVGTDHNEFIEGSEFYVGTLDIMLEYGIL